MTKTKKTGYVISLIPSRRNPNPKHHCGGMLQKERMFFSSTDTEAGQHILYAFKGFAWRFKSRKEAMSHAEHLFKGSPVMDTVKIEKVVDSFPSYQINADGEYV